MCPEQPRHNQPAEARHRNKDHGAVTISSPNLDQNEKHNRENQEAGLLALIRDGLGTHQSCNHFGDSPPVDLTAKWITVFRDHSSVSSYFIYTDAKEWPVEAAR